MRNIHRSTEYPHDDKISSWAPVCPKCEGTNVSIEKDYQWNSEPYLHCGTCGFRMYGKKRIVEELSRQRSKWDGRNYEEIRDAVLSLQKEVRIAAISKERKLFLLKKEEKTARAKEALRLVGKNLQQRCAYFKCDNPRRPHSKYCSDKCRKNRANYFYRIRKRREKLEGKNAS